MKTTTSAKALDFTRHTHPGHKGRGFHPKTQKSGQRSMYPLFPPESWPTEKTDNRSELFQFFQPPGEKTALRFLLCQGELFSYLARASGIRPSLRHRSAGEIFAAYSKIFTAQSAENDGAIL